MRTINNFTKITFNIYVNYTKMKSPVTTKELMSYLYKKCVYAMKKREEKRRKIKLSQNHETNVVVSQSFVSSFAQKLIMNETVYIIFMVCSYMHKQQSSLQFKLKF